MNYSTNYRYAAGFSLIELMLAMLIGLIILGGVMQIYSSTRDTQRSSEDQLAMLGDARFAIESIGYDLRHTGLWGRHNNHQIVACQKVGSPQLQCPEGDARTLATNDCADHEYIYLERPLYALNNTNPYNTTCAAQSYKAGTDILTVRYADTNEIGTNVLGTGVMYLRTSLSAGALFIGEGPNSLPGGAYNMFSGWQSEKSSTNHALVSRAYYVSDYTDKPGDGLPSLRRSDLVAGPAMKSEVLLSGVEDFQLEFGVDSGINGVAGGMDGIVDAYVTADDIPKDTLPDGTILEQWHRVLSVRMWLLMRSERKDRDGIGSAQTFTIAGNKVTTANDGYRRYLVSSVIKMRNTFQRDLKQVGGQ